MSPKKRSVVLLSGGLDSAANLAWCAERDFPVLALTCRYGQRAEEREVQSARKFCEYYDVRHEVLDLPWLGRLGGSALTDVGQAVPRLDSSSLDDTATTRQTAQRVWVPNRNGIMINVAAAFAERLETEQIVVGFNREEAVTFPDNSMAFLQRATDALRFSTANAAQVVSYTSALDKREIVRALQGFSRPFPFELIWSCYYGEQTACGTCESCQRLQRALSVLSSRSGA